jgi:Taurine catabolism dioxygenase TauD, TfdA family/TubC N-terminal docking domain
MSRPKVAPSRYPMRPSSEPCRQDSVRLRPAIRAVASQYTNEWRPIGSFETAEPKQPWYPRRHMSSLAEFLTRLARMNVTLRADGGKLRCSGPDHVMTAELRAELAARKPELLAFLEEAKHPGGPDGMAAGMARGARDAPPPQIDREIDAAWKGADLPPEAGLVPIPGDCSAEITSLAAELRANPLPLPALRPADFELPACRALIDRVKRQLDGALGFAVIDHLDLTAMSAEEATAVYWLLASMVARPVAQKWDGTMIYDVYDLGKRSMRAVNTNDDMNYHTDNSFNLCPPHYVGLLCLHMAKEGGMSKIVNFSSVHNEMRRRHPDLLARLYRPFVFDRQREHAAQDEVTIRRPIFENQDGQLVGRMSHFHVRNGHVLSGERLDAEGEAAMAAMEAIMNEPGMGQEFWFEPGQIQIIDNRRIGHKRTAFADWPEPERKRRLVRLWLRDSGRPFYNG